MSFPHTFAKPSAVPVCVPKKTVTLTLVGSTSSSSSSAGASTSLGKTTGLFSFPRSVDLFHKNTNKPTITATDVVTTSKTWLTSSPRDTPRADSIDLISSNFVSMADTASLLRRKLVVAGGRGVEVLLTRRSNVGAG